MSAITSRASAPAKTVSRSRCLARCQAVFAPVALCVLAPTVASAQLDIAVVPSEKSAAIEPISQVPLVSFLTEGALLYAETRRSTDVVLFVARASNGRVVEQGQTAPFALDAKAASSSTGMPLRSALSEEQILRLPPFAGLSDAIAQSQATAQESISASRLLERPGDALRIPALDGSSEDVVSMQQGELVFIAAIPADPVMRERARTRPLFVRIAGSDLGAR